MENNKNNFEKEQENVLEIKREEELVKRKNCWSEK